MPRRKSENTPLLLTLEKAIGVLRLIARTGREMGVTEIAQELDMYPSVVSRIVSTLQAHSFLRQNPETLRYQLGLGILELSSAVLDSLQLNSLARPVLERLNEATGETIFLMVLDEGEGFYIQRIDGQRSVTIKSSVGHREPVHGSAVGKALVAFLPDSEVDTIINRHGLPRQTANTITDAEAFKAHLAKIRQLGFAIDDEEGEVGIRCIGAPIFDHTGKPVAAVSISSPAYRTPVEKLLEWRPLLLQGTEEISAHLGYRGR